MLVTCLDRLENVVGEEKAHSIFESVMVEIGLEELSSPEDELVFANALSKRGGLMAAIGSSLKVKAILAGAHAN